MAPKRRYLSYLRERWWVIMVCIALTVSALFVYETVRGEKVLSYAQLYASAEMQVAAVSFFNEEALTYFGTQIELLKSAHLQNAAYQRIGYVPKPNQPPPVKLEIIQPLKTSILELEATGSDPAITQNFLQALIDEYLNYKKEARDTISQEIMQSLTDQISKKEDDLKSEQDQWAHFQKSNNIVVLDQETRSAGLYLAELNMQLAKLKLDRDLLARGLDVTQMDSPAVMSAPAVTNATGSIPAYISTNFAEQLSSDAALKSAKVQLAVTRGERDQTLAEHGETAAHRLNDEVARLERTVQILEEQNLAERKATLEDLNKRISAMETSIPTWEAKVLDMNDRLSEGERLKSSVQREQGYYDHVLSTLQNVDLGKNVQTERLAVLQRATSPEPVKRHLIIWFALAVIGGFFMALGLVFCWYLLDDRFVSVRDIKEQYGEMVLGLVPQIRVPKSRPHQALLEHGDRRHTYAESYRHLRSAILFSSFGEGRPQTLLVTSSAPGEGKTTIALNLARLLARSGLRVVLVDADARRRGLSSLLNAKDQTGMLDFLRGDADAAQVTHPTDTPGLSYVPVGTHNELTEGVFLRPRLAELLRGLREERDFVIFDGAPILASDDAAVLVPLVDAVVLVTRPFYTRSRLIRQALDMLYQRQAKCVSFIHNRARADDLAGHYEMNGVPVPARNGAA
jgi:capsular exopolysaccharide synthesis family protein